MIKRITRRNLDDVGSSGSLNDLSFLLIIFFIVIAGFNVNKGFLLNLPSKQKPIIVNTEDILKCTLCADGSLMMDGQAMQADELSSKIQAKLQKWPNLTFLLTINPEAPYQSVVDVIAAIRSLKVENFSFKMETAE